jgi:hypothetical protein
MNHVCMMYGPTCITCTNGAGGVCALKIEPKLLKSIYRVFQIFSCKGSLILGTRFTNVTPTQAMQSRAEISQFILYGNFARLMAVCSQKFAVYSNCCDGRMNISPVFISQPLM